MGGEIITPGSDPHMPETIAHRLDSVKQKLKDLGSDMLAILKSENPNL